MDDVIIGYTKQDEDEWISLRKQIEARYDIKDLGNAEFILQMSITRDRSQRTLCLGQSQYVATILDRSQMSSAKAFSNPCSAEKLNAQSCPLPGSREKAQMAGVPYLSAIGSLNYAALNTRPDIQYAVNMAARFARNPSEEHWTAVKRILRYLKDSGNAQLTFRPSMLSGGEIAVKAYSDADWIGPDDSKSTTGWVVTVNGAPIAWKSQKQSIVAKSTMVAEMIAMSDVVDAVKWIKGLIKELIGDKVGKPLVLCDNQAALKTSTLDTSNSRVRHVVMHYHQIRDAVEMWRKER